MEKVVIKTPQFKNGKVDRYHIQTGTIERNKQKIIFSPLNGFVNGDHTVLFHSEEEFKKAIQ